MATQTVKTTYSLDVETLRALEELARRWSTSRSEALRRAIRASWVQAAAPSLTPIRALDRLQERLGLDARAAGRWATAVRAQRRDRSRRHEARRG
jgi:predicted transcriptional regulator